MSKPLFLLSNDDGIHAPGIQALADAVTTLGDVVIVAPHVERSGSGQGLTLGSPIRMERLKEQVYAVEGTPADCVMFAFAKLLDRKPDLVLSGINRGSNMGQDILYSGTVAAAMEGCLRGVPSIAFSLRGRGHHHKSSYEDAGRIVQLLLRQKDILQKFKDCVLNVNIPDVPLADIKGFKVTTLGRRIYDDNIVEGVDPRGRPYYWIGGGGAVSDHRPESDCTLLEDDWVTLTALQPDRVHEQVNLQLNQQLLQLVSDDLSSMK